MDFPIWLSWLTFPLNHPSDNEISGSCANKPKEIQTFLYPVYPATAKHHPGKYLNTPNLPQKVPASTSMHINRIYTYIYIYTYIWIRKETNVQQLQIWMIPHCTNSQKLVGLRMLKTVTVNGDKFILRRISQNGAEKKNENHQPKSQQISSSGGFSRRKQKITVPSIRRPAQKTYPPSAQTSQGCMSKKIHHHPILLMNLEGANNKRSWINYAKDS